MDRDMICAANRHRARELHLDGSQAQLAFLKSIADGLGLAAAANILQRLIAAEPGTPGSGAQGEPQPRAGDRYYYLCSSGSDTYRAEAEVLHVTPAGRIRIRYFDARSREWHQATVGRLMLEPARNGDTFCAEWNAR